MRPILQDYKQLTMKVVKQAGFIAPGSSQGEKWTTETVGVVYKYTALQGQLFREWVKKKLEQNTPIHEG